MIRPIRVRFTPERQFVLQPLAVSHMQLLQFLELPERGTNKLSLIAGAFQRYQRLALFGDLRLSVRDMTFSQRELLLQLGAVDANQMGFHAIDRLILQISK
jgi:hypothetical protein